MKYFNLGFCAILLAIGIAGVVDPGVRIFAPILCITSAIYLSFVDKVFRDFMTEMEGKMEDLYETRRNLLLNKEEDEAE